jgi:hypothetical protein
MHPFLLAADLRLQVIIDRRTLGVYLAACCTAAGGAVFVKPVSPGLQTAREERTAAR